MADTLVLAQQLNANDSGSEEEGWSDEGDEGLASQRSGTGPDLFDFVNQQVQLDKRDGFLFDETNDRSRIAAAGKLAADELRSLASQDATFLQLAVTQMSDRQKAALQALFQQ